MFYRKAEAFYYTRSLTRLHASFVDFEPPHKSFIFALLATSAISLASLLPPARQEVLRQIGLPLLLAAQREFSASFSRNDNILDAIQSAVLIAQIWYNQNRVTEGWLIATQGLRLAMLAGLHRLRISDIDDAGLFNELDEETGQRSSVRGPISRPAIIEATQSLVEFGERTQLL